MIKANKLKKEYKMWAVINKEYDIVYSVHDSRDEARREKHDFEEWSSDTYLIKKCIVIID